MPQRGGHIYEIYYLLVDQLDYIMKLPKIYYQLI